MRIFHLVFLVSSTLLLGGCSILTGFSDGNASGYRHWSKEECVPYARRVSGIQIRGNAWTWWDQAAGRYARGYTPAPGAVLVLAKTNKLRNGHLSVVTQQMSPRDIYVTHTNWGNDMVSRRVTYDTMRVQDISPNNDWTLVHFWNIETGRFGFPYPAYGFIYNMPESPLRVSAPAGLPASY